MPGLRPRGRGCGLPTLPLPLPLLAALLLWLPVPAHAEWFRREDAIMGTRIYVELWLQDATQGQAAIDAVIASMHEVDEMMSTYKPQSQLSRVNARAALEPVVVDRELFDVIQASLGFSRLTDGAFDVTYASVGYLYDFRARQRPTEAQIAAALPGVNWRHVQLDPAALTVRFQRPGMRIDLGGIAKGYAVDAALQALELPAGVQGYVDAGGDLRVAGPDAQRVVLDAPGQAQDALPVVELRNGALASSSGFALRRWRDGRWVGPHIHGSTAVADRFASVVAPDCTMADALTKVVLAAGANAASVLQQFGATAHLYSHEAGWLTIGGDL